METPEYIVSSSLSVHPCVFVVHVCWQANLEASLSALNIELTAEEIAAIDAEQPP